MEAPFKPQRARRVSREETPSGHEDRVFENRLGMIYDDIIETSGGEINWGERTWIG